MVLALLVFCSLLSDHDQVVRIPGLKRPSLHVSLNGQDTKTGTLQER